MALVRILSCGVGLNHKCLLRLIFSNTNVNSELWKRFSTDKNSLWKLFICENYGWRVGHVFLKRMPESGLIRFSCQLVSQVIFSFKFKRLLNCPNEMRVRSSGKSSWWNFSFRMQLLCGSRVSYKS